MPIACCQLPIDSGWLMRNYADYMKCDFVLISLIFENYQSNNNIIWIQTSLISFNNE